MNPRVSSLVPQIITNEQPQILTAPRFGPSMLPTQVRHKSTRIQATMQSNSLVEDLIMRNAKSADSPSAGGDLAIPEDARSKTSTMVKVAPPEVAGPTAKTDFRGPLSIPGHKRGIYVYRHADAHIPDAHKRRFGEIVDIFKNNLLEDRRLSMSRPADTMYKLKMCGVDEQEARPSILICHPLLDNKIGRLILRKLSARNLQDQYQCCSDDTRPGFKIYLYLSSEFQVLGNPSKLLSICTCRDSEVAQIVSNDKSCPVSTIACGVFIPGDSTIFALTSAHAFEDNGDEETGELAWSHDDSTSDSGSLQSDDISNHGSSGTDEDYDWNELEGVAAEERRRTFPSDSDNGSPLDIRDEKHVRCSEFKPGKVLGRPKDPKWARQPNLDWVLVEMPDLGVPVENNFVEPSGLSKAVATVLVATSSGLRQGTLSVIPSYIDSPRNSTLLTKIWTVDLAEHEQGRLQKGDSGSPVFDLTKKGIYGYVTAINYFGELHVMPLQAVLDQIWNMIQPLNSSAKPRIFKMTEPEILTRPHAIKSGRQSPVFSRLLQYWPQKLTVVPDMNPPESTVTRVAVAGTCGLALLIARKVNDETSHQLLILSRTHQSALISQGYQCQVVDYNDPSSLQHALIGIDTVISTVTGTPQLQLIEAAVQCRVRRFAPAEFEGQPSLREQNTVLDRGKNAALALLQHYQGHIQYTVFVCGILYERFSVNGMRSQHIGANTGYGYEGDYIANPRNMTALVPTFGAAQNLACVCLTSAYDVAQFVVRALDIPVWELEMSMYSERMTVNDLIEVIRACRNRKWARIDHQDVSNLQYELNRAQTTGDGAKYQQLAPLIATAEGRFDFAVPGYLNILNPDIKTTEFRDWFLDNWASTP